MNTVQRIMILEDDVTLAQGIRMALKGPDIEIALCRTLAEASLALRGAPFDLLILDINLPDGSGMELLQRIRQSSAVPVILLTANDMEMDIVSGLESGADDYITKPFSLAVLRARVGAQLRRNTPAKSRAIRIVGRDIYPHPETTMDENVEFLTKRPFRVKLIQQC